MIRSSADKETEKVFHQEFSKSIPHNVRKNALRKMMMINATVGLPDLNKSPPANHLESLSGNRLGQWSIRVNGQWRICFVPISGGSEYEGVEIVDYH